MRRRIPLRSDHILLGAIILLLGVTAVWRDTAPTALPVLPVIPAADRDVVPGASQPVALPVRAELSAAAERPLFNPNRKRALAAPASPQQQAASTKPFRQPVLLGVVGTSERRVALIKLPEEKDARRMRIGDSFDGWSISDIRTDAVIFRSGAIEHEIRLPSAKNNAGSTTGTRR
jgi:hypothetical protein